MAKFVALINFSPMTYRVLTLAYVVLSITGSILLLVYRKDLVEYCNVKEFISDETMRKAVFIFGQFWVISNWSLLYGISNQKELYVKLHLYYTIVVFIGFAVTLVLIAFMVLSAMVGIMDKENADLINMFGASMMVTLGLTFLLTIGIGILTLVIAMINLTLMGVVVTFIPIEEAAKVVKEGDDQQTKLLKSEDVLKEKECIA
ncbi:uncharacterized protein LOC120416431 [Culex pipiens pallens]|uniref:uncharacterized protein LOC120416431 n=1 Tax=Culex pipiens pallens TaxID=42434 RepID=UPI001953ECD3|nr:uncharacterized protein LOC120416431 [Culex pipiens pallens]